MELKYLVKTDSIKKMSKKENEFIDKVINYYDEEGMEYFVLNMHRQSKKDMKFFSVKTRKKIEQIYDILIKDTKKHANFLENIAKLCELK